MRMIPRRAILHCAVIIVLASFGWSSPGFCGAIHDAARTDDLGKIKALLKENPKLVSSKDDQGMTPLHWAAREDTAVAFLIAGGLHFPVSASGFGA